MTTDSDDTRRPARSSADVERALRSAYEATDRLPIEDDPSTARLSDPPERAGNRWRAPALVAAAAAVLVGAAWVDGKGAGAAGNVLNVSIVGDASDRAAAERRLRTIWGGPLCVSAATRTKAQLASILKEVQREVPSWLNGHVELDVVDLYVVVDEGDRLQRIFDQRYGAGVVRVTPALQPYEGEPVRSSAAPTSSS